MRTKSGSKHQLTCQRVLLSALCLAAFCLAPLRAAAARDYTDNPAYLEDVSKERDTTYHDLVIVPPPTSEGPTITERLFNEKLTKEFKDRYEEEFGRTEVDRVYNSPNRFTYYDDLYGFKGTPEQEDAEKQRYANFVLRRLAEYHVDNYAQHDEKLRGAWQAKERLKEMKVEVGQVSLDVQYSIAGNSLDLKMNNPYFPLARVRLQMDPGVVGPSPLQESTFSIGRNVTTKIALETHYKVTDGVLEFIGRRAITAALGSTFSTSTFTLPNGITTRESRYLAGVTYVF